MNLTRPMIFTGMFFWSESSHSKLTKQVRFALALVLIPVLYFLCLWWNVDEEMYKLTPIVAKDYYLQDHEATQKYFAQLNLEDHMETEWDSYVKTHFVDRMVSGVPVQELGKLTNIGKGEKVKAKKMVKVELPKTPKTPLGLYTHGKEIISFEKLKTLTKIGKNIDFIERINILPKKNINIIFRCKDKCKTIFTNRHIEEMMRFTAKATEHQNWKKFCMREKPENVVFVADGEGCSDKAYLNITKYVELNVKMGIIDDTMIQAQMNNTAQHIHELPEIRQLLGKNFNKDYPYSRYVVSQL